MFKNLIMIAAATCFMFASVAASASPQDDIQRFCADKNRRMPAPGKQFDGRPADATILGLKPGKYALSNTGTIEIFDKNAWLLTKPKTMITFFGPGRYSGGEIQNGNGTVGGCSQELLSEMMTKNSLSLLSVEPLK